MSFDPLSQAPLTQSSLAPSAFVEDTTIRSILNVAISFAGDYVSEWATGQITNLLFGDPNEAIDKKLDEILERQKAIQSQLAQMQQALHWDVIGSGYVPHENRIESIFKQYNVIAKLTDQGHRIAQLQSLSKTIISSSDGIWLDLDAIDQYLTQPSPTIQNDGLISLFMQSRLQRLLDQPANDAYVNVYYDSRTFLLNAFHTQYTGMTLYVNALLSQAPPETELAGLFMSQMKKRLENQLNLLESFYTPLLLNLVSLTNDQPVLKVKFYNQANGLVIYNTNPDYYHRDTTVSLRDAQNDDFEVWQLALFTNDNGFTRYRIIPDANQSGDNVYQVHTGQNGKEWKLYWWNGKDHPQGWSIIPSLSQSECFLLQNDSGSRWIFRKHHDHNGIKWPNLVYVSPGNLDEPFVQWRISVEP